MQPSRILLPTILAGSLLGCAPGAQPPAPRTEAPIATPPTQLEETTGTLDCEALLARIKLETDAAWVQGKPGACVATFTNAALGLELGTRGLTPTLKDGRWDLIKDFPGATHLRPAIVKGAKWTYLGVIFHLFPEKAGPEFRGPVPLVLTVAGSRGGVSFECRSTTTPGSQAESEKIQSAVDSACSDILARVRVDDLGRPAELLR